MLLLIALSLLPSAVSAAEPFIVVASDSPALVDAPRYGFSEHARTDPAEQQAVYQIMAATGNVWASSVRDICRGRWHGIECMPDRDEVYHIVSLSFGALSDDTAFPLCDGASSFLSSAVTELPHIRSLFFYRCFTGNPQPIPRFLGKLGATLRSLVLRENGLVGSIPSELGNLTSLQTLDLHGNNLESLIPLSLSRLAALQLLDLSSNRLTGTLAHLTLPNLTVMDLSNNHFLGKIPPSIGDCKSLIKLEASRNRLVGSIPGSIGNLKNLILLDLSHNRLSGPIPDGVGRLTSLRALILSSNPMGPMTIPVTVFTGLDRLEMLVMSNTGLQGPIPGSIGRLPALRVLHLDGNLLSGSIVSVFRNVDRLSELRLDGNRLTGPVPFDKRTVWRMKRKLRLSGNTGLCFHGNEAREMGAAFEAFEGISTCDAARAAVAGGSLPLDP